MVLWNIFVMLMSKRDLSACYHFGVYLKWVARSVMICLVMTAWVLFTVLYRSLILKMFIRKSNHHSFKLHCQSALFSARVRPCSFSHARTGFLGHNPVGILNFTLNKMSYDNSFLWAWKVACRCKGVTCSFVEGGCYNGFQWWNHLGASEVHSWTSDPHNLPQTKKKCQEVKTICPNVQI